MHTKTELGHYSFDPSLTGFHADNALFMAKCARLSYEPRELIQHVAQEIWHFPGFSFIEYSTDEDDVQAFMISDGQAIIASFRGTEAHKIQDWVNNMDTSLKPAFGGNVHQGFLRALEAIWDEFSRDLNFLKTADQKLFITGHSQGGALATLAAAKCIDTGIDFHQVYTFGAPRVGDILFSKAFNNYHKQKLFRVVNHGDIVTRVPTRQSSFYHCGTFFFLDEAGMLHQDSTYWTQFWDSLGVSIWDLLDMAIGEVEAHKTAAYIQKLAQI
ncbi:MAG: lipase family protein [Microscillaceae bacterium]|nr:lipase family protein [Microscillaceae bacterium]